MNNYTLNQAQQQLEQLQNYQQQIAGAPVRVYPFKIVSGLNYLSNRGLSDIGTNPGNSYVNTTQTMTTNIQYGAYSDLSLIYSGNKPIVCYWFGLINAVCNADGSITETVNASLDENNNWVPKQFANPMKDGEIEYPWKEIGVIDYAISPSETRKEQLDNVDVGVYSTIYNFSTFSNTWYPTFQEMNEFVYFIIDSRYACPIALRIQSITPHFRPDGVFQYCDIQFISINQYFNTTSRSILTFIKFGAVNDAYCFPQEVIEDGKTKTIINPNLLLNSQAGVDSICIKNNSLVAHLGTLIYGHPYVSFKANKGVLTRTLEPDRYLLPLKFEAPINDNIVSKHSLVHSSYSLAMNMVIVSEQLWSSWKQTKEIYNPIQNFTYQGGLAFAGNSNDGNSNEALYNTINQILNPTNSASLTDEINQTISPNQASYSSWGSGNLQVVMFSNKKNWPLDILQTQQWQPIGASTVGIGFYLYGSNVADIATWDFRFTNLCTAILQGINDAVVAIADVFSAGYNPNTTSTSEIGFLSSLSNGSNNSENNSFVKPNIAFILTSMSMKNVHMLEVNYRDGIVYTNTNRGQGGFLNMIANWLSGIADKVIGYTPGEAQFFMNTTARTYNLFIPSSLLPLFQQYLDPNGSNYNAIPLDIFNNSYDNNTAVGQLQYMSGLQFSLTDTYLTNAANPEIFTTIGWGKIPKNTSSFTTFDTDTNNLVLSTNAKGVIKIPTNSFMFFDEPIANENNSSFVIDEINVKELGQSNLHITYLKNNPQGKLVNVGEEWVSNNAKVMKNNAYIDNDFEYYVYDEYNTTFATNESPYLALQYAPLPSIISTTNIPKYTLPSGSNRGTYTVLATSTIKGVSFTTNTKHWKSFTNNPNNSYSFKASSNANYVIANSDVIGIEGVNDWSCPFGEWWLPGVSCVYQNTWGSCNSWYNYEPFPTTFNNGAYLNACDSSSTKINDGFLSGSEYISNCVFWNFSIMGNVKGPELWGQCCSMTDTVYYETIHLVFNINYLISTALTQWEFSMNTQYTNYYALVPSDFTTDEINNLTIPSNTNPNTDILIYDKNSNGHALNYKTGSTPSKKWDLYGYGKISFPSQTTLTNPASPTAYPPKSIDKIGLFATSTYLNGGGCVNMIGIPNAGLNQQAYNSSVVFTDSNGNVYNSNDTVFDTGAYQIQLWGTGNGTNYPTSPTSIYSGISYKLVMIVVK